MAEIVRNLGEAEKKGLISGNQNSNPNDIGKIINDVKSIMDTFKELKGMKPKENLQANSNLTTMTNKNVKPKGHTEEPQKIPLAVLKIDDEELNNYLDIDLKKIFDNPMITPETTLNDVVKKWGIIKRLLKPEIKKAISKIAKADLEFK